MFNFRFAVGSLFSLTLLATLYKIIPFFFFPPLLLITGIMLLFPLGALLYHRFRSPGITENTMGLILWASFAAFLLLLKTLSILPVLYQADALLGRYVILWLILVVGLVPVLLSAGAFEFALLENMAIRKKGYAFVLPYALFIASTLFAFALSLYIPRTLGLSALLVIAMLLLPLYLGATRHFRLTTVILTVLLSISIPPFISEGRIIDLINQYAHKQSLTLGDAVQPELHDNGNPAADSAVIYDNWGHLGYFRLEGEPEKSELSGSYYGRTLWKVKPESFKYQPLDKAIFRMLSDLSGKVAIIGSGGGRQVEFAFNSGVRIIHAVDIEESLPSAMQKAAAMGYPNPYTHPGVQFFNMDGRRFLESVPAETYSLILIADAGSFPDLISTMLTSHGMLHTREAYGTYKDKLKKNGLLVFWCPKSFPGYKHIMKQYIETMRAAGMNAAAFENTEEFMVTGSRDMSEQQIEKHVLSFNKMFSIEKMADVPEIKARVATDQTMHSGLTYLVGHETAKLIIILVSSILGLLCLSALIGFSVLAGKGYRKKTAWTASLALLVGLNYILLQVATIYAISMSTYDIYAGAVAGVTVFLLSYLIGSVMYYILGRKNVPSLFILLLIAAFSAFAWGYPLIFILTLSVACSIFFPVLFEFCETERSTVFVMDAIGTVVGAFLAFGITYLFGTAVLHLVIAALVLIIVSVAVPLLNGMRRERMSCS